MNNSVQYYTTKVGLLACDSHLGSVRVINIPKCNGLRFICATHCYDAEANTYIAINTILGTIKQTYIHDKIIIGDVHEKPMLLLYDARYKQIDIFDVFKERVIETLELKGTVSSTSYYKLVAFDVETKRGVDGDTPLPSYMLLGDTTICFEGNKQTSSCIVYATGRLTKTFTKHDVSVPHISMKHKYVVFGTWRGATGISFDDIHAIKIVRWDTGIPVKLIELPTGLFCPEQLAVYKEKSTVTKDIVTIDLESVTTRATATEKSPIYIHNNLMMYSSELDEPLQYTRFGGIMDRRDPVLNLVTADGRLRFTALQTRYNRGSILLASDKQILVLDTKTWIATIINCEDPLSVLSSFVIFENMMILGDYFTTTIYRTNGAMLPNIVRRFDTKAGKELFVMKADARADTTPNWFTLTLTQTNPLGGTIPYTREDMDYIARSLGALLRHISQYVRLFEVDLIAALIGSFCLGPLHNESRSQRQLQQEY